MTDNNLQAGADLIQKTSQKNDTGADQGRDRGTDFKLTEAEENRLSFFAV